MTARAGQSRLRHALEGRAATHPLRYYGPRMSDLVELLSDLVAIDSVNPEVVSGGAGEGEIARFVAGWLERAGLEVTLQEAAPGRPNVVGIRRGSGGGCSLVFNAHMDTVGVAGMDAAHEPRVEGD